MTKTNEIPKSQFILAGILVIAVALIVPLISAQDESQAKAEPEHPSGLTRTVMIAGYDDDPVFVPSLTEIQIGDSVTFINQDGRNGGIAHSVMSVGSDGIPTGQFESSLLHVGDAFKIQFHEAGVYQYIDSIYPNVRGVIVVV